MNLRKTAVLLFLVATSLGLQAQVPNGINYQAMALDTAGNPLQNQTIGIRMGIVEQNSSNAPVFQETHSLSTDANGIFSLQIGMGTATINSIDSVDWANSPVYLKVEIDRNGGTNYSLIGFTEFFTVPYAFRAAYGEDADADPANELQTLSLQNGALDISGGNSVDLQSGLFTFDANRVLFADDRNNSGFSVPIDSGTTATNNTAFGHGTGNASMTGYQNSLLGHRAGQSLTSGYANTYLGSLAGQKSTTAYGNVALGNGAGEKNLSGQHNVFVGDQAGKNALGAYNTIVGKSAGYSLTTGTNNVFLGTNAGVYNQVGHSNVFIGKDAGFNETGSNRLYIDNSNTSSPLIHGKFDTNELTINGDLDITGNVTQNGGPLSVNPDDNDSTNELQTLAIVGDTLNISDGNSVVLPGEMDGDSTNELQILSLNGEDLSISNGNTVTIPSNNSLDSDLGVFIMRPSFGGHTYIIQHDLGAIPTTIEVEWSTDNQPALHHGSGSGKFHSGKSVSLAKWKMNDRWQVHPSNSIIQVVTNSGGHNWRAIINDVTTTYFEIRVMEFHASADIKGIWQVFK